MSTVVKQKDDNVKVRQYITDAKGHKLAAVIDMKELSRVGEMLEDLYDLKAIKERKNEADEDYEAYSKKRKARLNV